MMFIAFFIYSYGIRMIGMLLFQIFATKQFNIWEIIFWPGPGWNKIKSYYRLSN